MSKSHSILILEIGRTRIFANNPNDYQKTPFYTLIIWFTVSYIKNMMVSISKGSYSKFPWCNYTRHKDLWVVYMGASLRRKQWLVVSVRPECGFFWSGNFWTKMPPVPHIINTHRDWVIGKYSVSEIIPDQVLIWLSWSFIYS